MPRIGAIVLAAGYSSRMGRFKPLLPLNGSPAILAVLGLLRRAGIEQIVVVTGHRAEDLRPVAEPAGAVSC
ncbi:MAG: NTP transferase domain-containing protein [Terracidiphilus sp.]